MGLRAHQISSMRYIPPLLARSFSHAHRNTLSEMSHDTSEQEYQEYIKAVRTIIINHKPGTEMSAADRELLLVSQRAVWLDELTVKMRNGKSLYREERDALLAEIARCPDLGTFPGITIEQVVQGVKRELGIMPPEPTHRQAR